MIDLTTLEARTLLLARVAVMGMAFSMPISRSAFNVSAALMILGWIASGAWRTMGRRVLRDPVTLACIAFVGACTISLFSIERIGNEHWNQLLVYSKVLYVPLAASLITNPQWLRRSWNALIAGLLVILSLMVVDIWVEIPGTVTYGQHVAGYGVFYHHIAQGMGLAFLGAYGLHRALDEKRRRQQVAWLTVALVVASIFIFFGIGRTAQLSVIAAYGIVVFAHLKPRWRLMGAIFSAVILGTMIGFSSHMQDRFSLAVGEAQTYKQDGDNTSVGARLKAWELSIELIKQQPWLGHGVGSYRSLAYEHFQESPICGLGVCEQPHNQFLMTAVETGLIGVMALVAFVLSALWRSSQAPFQPLFPAFVTIFVITAFFDSALSIRAEGFFTVTVLSLLTASRLASKSSGCERT